MKKTFELPKEFAEKWIEALENGNYKQTTGTLLSVDYPYLDDKEDFENPIMDTCAYCCLGVAAIVAGCKFDQIIESDLLSDAPEFYMEKGIPQILTENVDSINLIAVLTSLNDGLKPEKKEIFKTKYPNLKFSDKKANVSGKVYYNFKEIAEFIKLNVEFV